MKLATKRVQPELCDGCNRSIDVGERYGIDKRPTRGGHKAEWVRRYCSDCTSRQLKLPAGENVSP